MGIELCLRGYEGGPFTETAAAKYGVEPPTDIQKKVSRTLGLYLKQRLNIQHLGTSADPVRDHTRCYDAQGRVLIGSEYLVPEAHCDDFSSQDRQEMGIMSAEQMAEIFRNRANLSALFELDVPAKVKLTNQ
ncbi:hypothetical protein H6768_05400 [Candidatus Peribacteria bacterium]|nr:hypothetical protein [Candidatus Peribacteria bacterium]